MIRKTFVSNKLGPTHFIFISTFLAMLASCSAPPKEFELKMPVTQEGTLNMQEKDYPEADPQSTRFLRDVGVSRECEYIPGQKGAITCTLLLDRLGRSSPLEFFLTINDRKKLKTGAVYTIPNSLFAVNAAEGRFAWYGKGWFYKEISGLIKFRELSDTCISFLISASGRAKPYKNDVTFSIPVDTTTSQRQDLIKTAVRVTFPGKTRPEMKYPTNRY